MSFTLTGRRRRALSRLVPAVDPSGDFGEFVDEQTAFAEWARDPDADPMAIVAMEEFHRVDV